MAQILGSQVPGAQFVGRQTQTTEIGLSYSHQALIYDDNALQS
jgi:hypothetical protein